MITDGPIPVATSWRSSSRLARLALFLSTSPFGVSVWTSQTVMALECFDESTPVGAQARRTEPVFHADAAAHKLRLIIFPDAARERGDRARASAHLYVILVNCKACALGSFWLQCPTWLAQQRCPRGV